jgi:hypothetical protein
VVCALPWAVVRAARLHGVDGLSYSFAQSGVISAWIAIYPIIACVELINIYRAAHDIGESYGNP